MKRTVMIAVVIGMIVIAGASAQPFGPGMMGGGYRGTDVETETIERTGLLVLAAGEIPVLSAGGTQYQLHIHPAIVGEIEVTNGEQITVEGELLEMRNPDLVSTDRVILVQALEADGTRVLAPAGGFGPMGDYGRMGRSGPMGRSGGGYGNYRGMMGYGQWDGEENGTRSFGPFGWGGDDTDGQIPGGTARRR